jgi:hypothetical protein
MEKMNEGHSPAMNLKHALDPGHCQLVRQRREQPLERRLEKFSIPENWHKTLPDKSGSRQYNRIQFFGQLL